MSRNAPHIFTSESVGEGHPDKVADYISDSILDACLAQDKTSRVACETLVKSNMVIIAGELTTKAVIDPEKIARQAIREIGYCNRQDDDVFHADTVFFTNLLTEQSPDIAQGVDARRRRARAMRSRAPETRALCSASQRMRRRSCFRPPSCLRTNCSLSWPGGANAGMWTGCVRTASPRWLWPMTKTGVRAYCKRSYFHPAHGRRGP